ncbi:hypothetical protein EDB84DRAFT_1446939, partial [Lactarius hengduanensis]
MSLCARAYRQLCRSSLGDHDYDQNGDEAITATTAMRQPYHGEGDRDDGPKTIALIATRRRRATRKPRRRRRGDRRVKAMATRCNNDHRATTTSLGMDLYSTSNLYWHRARHSLDARTLAQQSHVTIATTRTTVPTAITMTIVTGGGSDEVIRGDYGDDKAAAIGDYDEVMATRTLPYPCGLRVTRRTHTNPSYPPGPVPICTGTRTRSRGYGFQRVRVRVAPKLPGGSDEDFPPYESSYRPSGGSGGGDLPEIIIQLQKQLLKDYTLPPSSVKWDLSKAVTDRSGP